ncbi:hypothetical protein DEU56DRAFT_757414 [Suillus clintonianus]|uniref:uncharacterized protein n=1 Tax=Suillus clintonianus TaxID=1904413 RepID=UPI001B861A10|nr:uncharacterized protein DEU56DRAFT_757414 [Suillus clintonianus]KAG2132068.1 hypothetical protein DEU56DRAFT_757414 [Suillus clintonianus]
MLSSASTDSPSPPTTPSVLRSEPNNSLALTDATMHVAPYVPPVPHPSELHAPLPSEHPDAYWVVTVGQEVGIFFHWLDVGERTQGISGAIQVRQETWADALRLYTRKYDEGAVEARPHVGGRFWPPHVLHTAPASPASSANSSEDSIWTRVEDLSDQMSQVTRY